MAYYDYTCEACNHNWEHEAPMNDPPLTQCPKCQQHFAKRLISGSTSFVLKSGGVGWSNNSYSK